MKRLELVIVQFEEIKGLIKADRIPQLRLAHILLDSAVELIMHRMIRAELHGERYDFDRLETLRRIEVDRQSEDPRLRRFATRGPSSDNIRAEIERLAEKVTSRSQRRDIGRDFGRKIDFLAYRKKLPEDLGPVLKRLHEYRNETYHRDQHRIEVIRPAVLIYFDAACTVLDRYEPGVLIDSHLLGPELERFQADLPSRTDWFELPRRAAKRLREEVGLDLTAVRTALVDHLVGRLYDLESGLTYIEENITGGAIPGDGIRAMQVKRDDVEAIFDNDVMRSRPYPSP